MTMHSVENSSLTFIIEERFEKPIEVCETTRRGRGVFAKKRFEAGDLIESAPVIVLPPQEEPAADSTLYHYSFAWNEGSALALGYGSLYNHSYASNAYYVRDEENRQIHFIAKKTIEKGQEITLNYNGDESHTPLWFDVH